MGQLRSSISLTKMLVYSVELYKTLQVDGNPGYIDGGSLRLASSKERLEELERQGGFSKSAGLAAELIRASEAQRDVPVDKSEWCGGRVMAATDGSAKAPILAQAMANSARERGATFYANTGVSGIDVVNGRVQAVETSRGQIRTDIVVAAAGIWSPPWAHGRRSYSTDSDAASVCRPAHCPN